MNKKTIIIHIAVVLSLVLVGILSRTMPHPWNFTPLSAIALVVTAYYGWRYGAMAILLVLLASDLMIGFYHWQMMFAVYGSLLLAVALGTLIHRKKVGTILFASLGSSLLFYFITNWAVWQFGTMYSPDWSGLSQSYFMALPFFRNSLAGDLIFTATLFSVFETAIYFKPKIVQFFSPVLAYCEKPKI
ncbi:MAG TPA: DUF6580 family putative transport protein [Candidatus Paceibacterota bacterium]|nr:DUF6580 family putative transport protein [Candidatus Paceibacterota bacterium]